MATKRRATGAAKVFRPFKGRPGGVWWLKLVDADGRQFKERLGEDVEALAAKGVPREEARRLGWNRTKAEAERRRRADELKTSAYRRTRGPLTQFAELWADTVLPVLGKKRSTTDEYRRIATRVIPEAFGHLRIEQLGYEEVAGWVAQMHAAGVGARTVHNRLNVLNLLFREAIKRGVIPAAANPIPYVDRPAAPRRSWRILAPADVQLVVNTWKLHLAELEGDDREEAALYLRLWLFALSTAMRRGELLGLRWRRVHLADPEGPHLEVAETIVHYHEDTPKSEHSHRTLPLGRVAAEVLAQQLAASSYTGTDDFVWPHPLTGGHFDPKAYAACLRAVLVKAGLTRPDAKRGDPDYMRPFHDLRHTSITNEARAGRDPLKIQARAGHSSFETTQLYIHLAGEQLRDGIDDAEARILGEVEL